MVNTFTPGFNPKAIFDRLEDLSRTWTTFYAQHASLDVHTKPLLAKITLEFMEIGKSRVESETAALADVRYKTHIDGLIQAKERALRAKASYDNAMKWADLKQTEESSARSLITRNG